MSIDVWQFFIMKGLDLSNMGRKGLKEQGLKRVGVNGKETEGDRETSPPSPAHI